MWSNRLSVGRAASLDVTVLSGSCAVDEGVLANEGRLVLRAGVCAGVERVSVDDCLSVLFGINDDICVISPVTINLALRPMRVKNILICEKVVF